MGEYICKCKNEKKETPDKVLTPFLLLLRREKKVLLVSSLHFHGSCSILYFLVYTLMVFLSFFLAVLVCFFLSRLVCHHYDRIASTFFNEEIHTREKKKELSINIHYNLYFFGSSIFSVPLTSLPKATEVKQQCDKTPLD